MTKKTKVAVVGVGYLGSIHAKIYAAMENVDLVAVVDIDRPLVESVALENHCEAHTDIGDLPSRIDAVSIVVPTSMHLEVSRKFLKTGVHMMLEKPIASTVTESTEIVELARKHGTILQIGHLERFNAGVMKLADLARNPRFIEAHRLGKFLSRAVDVDVITDLMIHDIDIILSLVDADITSISANGCKVITDHVDIANARLEFSNGAVANVTASRVSRKTFRRIRVFSEDRYLGLDFTSQQLEEARPGKTPEGSGFPEMVHKKIEVEPQLPLNSELSHFIHCVENGGCPLVSGEDGLLAVGVAERVRNKIAQSMSY